MSEIKFYREIYQKIENEGVTQVGKKAKKRMRVANWRFSSIMGPFFCLCLKKKKKS